MDAQKRLDDLRREALARLERIAEESGPESQLYQHCRDLWRRREAEAQASLLYEDFANARVVLERGVHVLTHAPEVLKRDGLAFEDVVKLMDAA